MTQPPPDAPHPDSADASAGAPTFELDTVGIRAQGQPRGDKFVVLAGSGARATTVPSLRTHGLREALIAFGKLVSDPVTGQLKFIEDTAFDSVSTAATVTMGRTANGRTEWKMVGTRRTYGDWLAEQPGQFIGDTVIDQVQASWRPFLQELALKVLDYQERQPELVGVLRDAGIAINHDEGEELREIDPFTFFSLILKHNSDASALRLFGKVGAALGVQTPLPADLSGVPRSSPMNAWFFAYRSERQPSDIPTLWQLARQAVAGELDAGTFEAALKIRKVALSKLTQGLFWLNPQRFLPLNGINVPYLRQRGIGNAGTVKTLAEYQAVLQQAQALAPDYPSLSHAGWLWARQSGKDLGPEEGETIEPQPTPDPADPSLSPRISLNQILYGPPGTGKTYHVVDEALKILDPEFLAGTPDREAVKARYDELAAEGAISFVTFHQSFGYEDFVEGIKPVMEGGALRYEERDGIFLEAVRAAGGLSAKAPAPAPTLREGAQVWRIYIDGAAPVSQIRDRVLARGEMRVGNFGQPRRNWAHLGTDELGGSALLFREGVRVGDLMLLATGTDTIGAAGVVTGEYEYQPETDPVLDTEYVHARRVHWLATGLSVSAHAVTDRQFAPPTLQPVKGATAQQIWERLGLSSVAPVSASPAARRHVLIIDEINRGNVAKIFGELITLLEPGKRAGQREALTVKLPLSRRPLSVPETLYVIGTMNTADRSLTQLDTALRRRFTFRPVWPRPEVLPVLDLDEGQLDLPAFLTAINGRIERLLSREQVIGHAYLLGLPRTLGGVASALRERILPQLEEYFFDDWAKIREVLGDDRKPAHLQFILEEGKPGERFYRLNDPAFEQIEAFVQVYATGAAAG